MYYGTNAIEGKYLTLRAGQGVLPATRVGKGWRTSKRALDLYIKKVAR